MDKKARSTGTTVVPQTTLSEHDLESEEPPSPRATRALRSRPASTGRTIAEPGKSPRLPRTQAATVRRREVAVQTLDPPPLAGPLTEARPRQHRTTSIDQLQVVVLYSLALGLERGRPQDRIADEETGAVARAITTALEGQVRRVEMVPVWNDLPTALARYDPNQVVVFNLVESLGGRPFTEPEPPRILRSMGFVHTGASYRSLVRTANKLTTKKLIEAAGLRTPRYQVFRSSIQRSPSVSLPAIVKPVAEGGSFGITQDSLATTPEGLTERIRTCLEIYRQPALVEEYIAGREINVALWGNGLPEVLPISEIVFDWTGDPLKQFVTFECKWLEDSPEYRGTPAVCPARLTQEEQERIETAAVQAYRLLGVKGYARVDMRLKDGIPYILEVNGNPDLAPDAGFFRSAKAAGYSYPEMLVRILQLALSPRP